MPSVDYNTELFFILCVDFNLETAVRKAMMFPILQVK